MFVSWNGSNQKNKKYLQEPTLQTGNTSWCGWRFDHIQRIAVHVVPKETFFKKISSLLVVDEDHEQMTKVYH